MQKVSRTMLAVVAAVQSGMHTRRKPKYIKEQALVSYLYPLRELERSKFNCRYDKVMLASRNELDRASTKFSFEGEIRNSKVEIHQSIDSYAPSTVFEANMTKESVGGPIDIDYGDSYYPSLTFEAVVTSYSITDVLINIDSDSYTPKLSVEINITKT